MPDKTKRGHYAPLRLKMLVTVVDKDKAASYADLLHGYDVNLQMLLPARGTAKDANIEFWGLSDSDRTVIFSVIREDREEEILDVLEERFRTIKRGNGIALTLPMSGVVGRLIFGFLSNDKRAVNGEGF